jgi:A/G-specific adenine glycosylase
MDVSTLDGNIKRVYARIFDVTEPIDTPAGEKLLWQLADKNLPKGHAGDYNQALMDLGATICVPKNPRCLICPVMKLCKARQNGTQNERPVVSPKKDVPHYVHAAGVIIQRGKVLVAQRPSTGLLGGMWEFPNGRVNGDPAKELPSALRTGYRLKVRMLREPRAERSRRRSRSADQPEALGTVQHGYSHFSVTVHVFPCELLSIPKETNLKWVSLNKLQDYPMGKIDRQIAGMIAKNR